MRADLRVLPADEWAEGVAQSCIDVLRGALDRQDLALWALTGGSSPLPAYRRIAEAHRAALDWSRVVVLMGDERWVPHTHPDSNFGAARAALVDRLPFAPEHVIPFPTHEETPEATAERYAHALHVLSPDAPPALDLLLLGLGGDGHIASLFPGSPALDERNAWAAATEAPAGMPVRQRVTLTFPVLDAARRVFFLATGPDKAEIVARALHPEGERLPVHRLRPAGPVTWWLDPPAARRLPEYP